MRVAIVYPPILHEGRLPVLSQSRIFSFTHSAEIRIYPLVMASTATILSKTGHRVLWLDGISEGLSMETFWKRLEEFKPELLVLETKVTMIRKHWDILRSVKERLPGAKTIVVGDHVSFFPEETMKACPTDFVAVGGDWDVVIGRLAEHLDGKGAMPGAILSRDGTAAGRPDPELGTDLNDLPWVDRDLTRWQVYGEAYLYRPVAYILSGRGCSSPRGAGRCTFCIWQYALWRNTARLRDPKDTAREVEYLHRKYGVREVFDDNEAGAVWNTDWLSSFADEVEKLGVAGKVYVSSNARADSVTEEACRHMKRAGFRLLKIGLESANDDTLRRLGKDETVEDIERGVKLAKDHGFAVMITTMIGFPWEGEREVRKTYAKARELLLYKAKRGDCLEANVMIPYPGTPLHDYVLKNGWFTIDPLDYEMYGLSKPVASSPVDPIEWGRRLWKLHRHPLFLARSLLSVRSAGDLLLGLRGLRSLLGHERDYPGGSGGTGS